MKFSFKIQQYQTDAVDAVARVFQGQPYNAGVSYLRDMGNLSAQPQQLSLVSSGDDRHRKACWLAALRQDAERHRHEVYSAPDGEIRHFQREEN